jgi:hypothetical protein
LATNRLARDHLDGLGIFTLMITALALPPRRSDASVASATGGKAARARIAAAWQRFLGRVDQWFWRAQQAEIESYLARSRDIFELEARMRHLERRRTPFGD